MNHKLKRIKEIYTKYKEPVDRINYLNDLLCQKHGTEETTGVDWSTINTPTMHEFVKLVEFMHSELRDEYLVTEKTSQQYLWDTLRLAYRGRI